MTLVDTITALSERFLRERTFELVVAPAIADLQFDGSAEGPRRASNGAAVLSAFAWGVYEDVFSDPGGLLTFAGLALLPAGYYTLLMMICAPVMGYELPMAGGQIVVGAALAALSFGPVLACYWPDRPARPARTDG